MTSKITVKDYDKALQQKLRYEYHGKELSTEELYDLTPEQLNEIYHNPLNSKLKYRIVRHISNIKITNKIALEKINRKEEIKSKLKNIILNQNTLRYDNDQLDELLNMIEEL